MFQKPDSLPRLTDAQLIALSQAAQRDDRIVLPSSAVHGAAAERFFAALRSKGLIEPATGACVGDHKQDYVISSRGLEALGLDVVDGVGMDQSAIPASVGSEVRDVSDAIRAGKPPDAPRASSKLAQVIALLSKSNGAAISDVMAATGWLAHTTRAALTSLRKRGYRIERIADSEGGTSRYRLVGMTATTVGA